ncbi:MAG: prolipoprotein diacylglyceryl transferase [Pseudomonadota bacterium]|nr:MAG: prolipoprotein diacylglyceryl transferase [Pseudomonadota bacterium]
MSSPFVVQFDPVAFSVFGFHIHWYGLMYLIAFVAGWWLGRVRTNKPGSSWSTAQMDDLVFYAGLGIILGGRLGYVLFYDLPRFVSDPMLVLQIWKGGMSFHGGFVGVMIAMWFFARRYNKPYWVVVDFIAPLVPTGLLAGRIGNFINGELWGKVTDLPWGMIFPRAGDALTRHPNPLYEALLEGVVMFVVLWWFSSKPRPVLAVSAVFAIMYGGFRFLIEFVRVPDAHIGYLAFGWLTMGQVLSLPLLIAGIIALWWAYNRPLSRGETAPEPE